MKFEPENSSALGFGFRCGFLGMLHMEIVHERLEREYNVSIIKISPNCNLLHVILQNDQVLEIHNPSLLPDNSSIKSIEEPIIGVEILVAPKFLGNIIKLCEERRGAKRMNFSGTQAMLSYELPMNEVVTDFLIN